MEEIFSEYIGLLAFLVFLVFPRLFKWIITRKGRTPNHVEKTIGELLQGESIQVESEAEIAARRAETDKIRKRSEKLLFKAKELSSLCSKQAGALTPMKAVVESAVEHPASNLTKELKQLQARGTPPKKAEVATRRSRYRALKKVLALVEQAIDQRRQPVRARLLGILDIAAKNHLMIYSAHARRSGAPYSTRFAFSIFEANARTAAEALKSSSAAATVADPKLAELPQGWINPTSDIALDVYHSIQGLSQQLSRNAGAAVPPASVAQSANAKLFIAGLTGAWLPRIFADAAVAIYLGPDAATGLAASQGRGTTNESRELTVAIGDGAKDAPMHVRIFAMCRALQYTKFADEAESIWNNWTRRIGSPTAITVEDASKKSVNVPLGFVMGALSRAVDAAVAVPVDALGGRLIDISGLRCTEADRARMNDAAALLAEGTPVNAPPRIIIGAALAALRKSPTVERRIGTTALKSMGGEGIFAPVQTTADAEHITDVLEAAASPSAVLRAVALGAVLAPRRTVNSPWK